MSDGCLFCAIVAGDIPARVVAEDDRAVAFLDIAPWHRGHTLVVPRRHVDSLLDDPAALTETAPLVGSTARLLRDQLHPAGLNLLSSAGRAAGQEVFHLHLHLVPRYADAPGLAALARPTSVPDGELDAVLADLRGTTPR